MAAHNHNPAVSPEQYRLAQAVLSGTVRGPSHMSVSVAREIVDRTPARLRSEYSRYTTNPSDPLDRFSDLQKQGFMKLGRKKKVVTMYRAMTPHGATYTGPKKEIADEHVRRYGGHVEKFKGTQNPGGVEVELTKHHHFLPFSTKKAAETMKRLLVAEGVEAKVKKVGGEWGVDHTHANPFYGTDLDLETTMAPAWMYYDSKQERDTAARMYEGRGKQVVLGHSMFGFKEGSGKKWRLRGVDHRGNPSKAFGGDVRQQLLSAVTQYDMKEQEKAAKRGPRGYYNMYALPQYLGRVSDVMDDISAGTPVRKALTSAFTGRLLDVTLKAVGEPRSSKEEQRGGPITYSPTRGNPRTVAVSAESVRIGNEVSMGLGVPYKKVVRVEYHPTDIDKEKFHFADGTKTGYISKSKIVSIEYRELNNPQPAADDMYSSFHGEQPDEVIEYENEEHYHSHLAALGELVELKVKLVNGGRAVIGFESSGEEEEAENPRSTRRPTHLIKKATPAQIQAATEYLKKRYREHIEKYPRTQETVDEAQYVKVNLPYTLRNVMEGYGHWAEQKQNPFWPFNSFTHTTIYHVGTGEKYKKSGSYKGYTLYKKLDTDEFLVPALDKDSRFDTLKDVKEFVNAWTKHQKNPKHRGPFHSAGQLLGRGTRAVRKPMDQFLGTAGKVGGYLDDELGRAINPGPGPSTGPVYLTSNEDGSQLFIIGGDQSLDLPGLGITGPESQKELVTIGHVTNICYHTRKIFDGKEEEYDYVHKFSEDSHGPLPVLIYDRINQQLKLSGGVYKIERPLIGTSPGIED